MVFYLLRKLLYGILVLWGVITLVFAIFSINPGDPARMLLGQRVDEASLRAVRTELGLDMPWHKQYLLYLNDVSPISLHSRADTSSRLFLDSERYTYVPVLELGQKVLVLKRPYLRRSFQSRRPVWEIIAEALPGTVILAVGAIVFALVLGIVLGVLSAVFKDSFIDRFTLFSAVLGMSLPSFFAAIVISWLGGYLWAERINLSLFIPAGLLLGLSLSLLSQRSVKRILTWSLVGFLLGCAAAAVEVILADLKGAPLLPWQYSHLTLPGTGLDMTGSLYAIDVFTGPYLALPHIILPLITLGIRPLAIVVQLTRNSLLDTLGQDYIRTARSKGLSEWVIIFRHALQNALNPVVTAISGWFASMLAGAVFIEFIFNWRGLGLRVFQALQTDDYPVVMGAVLVIASSFVVINIFIDLLYGWLDPRIRLK